MSTTESPPTSAAALSQMAAAERRYELAGLSRKIFLALLLVQLAASAFYAGLYFELVRTGPINALRLTAVVLGLIFLCVGAVFVLLARPRGRRIFVAAGLFLLYSVPLWGWAYAWGWVIGLGVALCVLGYRIVLRMAPKASGDAPNAA